MRGPPGATTALKCSLCRAGTYGTGSGQGLGFGIELTLVHYETDLLLHSVSLDLSG